MQRKNRKVNKHKLIFIEFIKKNNNIQVGKSFEIFIVF